MDPNETLRRMRELHTQWNEEAAIDSVDLAAAMFDYFDALDTWLSRGGFLPDAWQRQDAYNAGQQAEATARYNAGQIGDDKPMSE
jgi:hypothetical protein